MLTEQPRLIKYSPLQTEQKAPPTRCDIHISFSSLCLCSVFLLALKVSVASLLFFLLFCALSLFLSLSQNITIFGAVCDQITKLLQQDMSNVILYIVTLWVENTLCCKELFLKKKGKKKKLFRWDSDHDSVVDGDRDFERLLAYQAVHQQRQRSTQRQWPDTIRFYPKSNPCWEWLCLMIH